MKREPDAPGPGKGGLFGDSFRRFYIGKWTWLLGWLTITFGIPLMLILSGLGYLLLVPVLFGMILWVNLVTVEDYAL